MFRVILSLLLLVVLSGQRSCESPQMPEGASFWCWGAPDPGLEMITLGVGDRPSVASSSSYIINGDISVDRRSTAFLATPGVGLCSAVIVGPHTALSAAHCRGDNDHYLYLDKQDFIDGFPADFVATNTIEHPDWRYWKYGADLRYKDTDIMILHFEDQELPGPYPRGFYDPAFASLCEGMLAQGWGRDENREFDNLREKEYTIIGMEGGRFQTVDVAQDGTGCFGDSGSPLYAFIGDDYYLVGVFSSIFNTECTTRTSHISVYYFKDWIYQNFKPN